jgi:hypothetical protein
MDNEELHEGIEHAHKSGEKRIGLTMAIVAVLLAFVSMLGRRAETEELKLTTQATDQWGYYQAKNNRGRLEAEESKMAALMPGERSSKVAAELSAESEKQRREADEVQKKARELDAESDAAGRKGDVFDMAEVLLEISIVLCSISLLMEGTLYWRLSFVTTAIGIALTVLGFLRH